ncbi:MAG: hypothetical protein ACYDGO_13495 [Smithellaceae bacterium]
MKKRLFGLFYILICMALLSGCAAPKYNYMPDSRHISEPPLNTITIVQVGDEMARQGKVTEHDAIHVKTPLKVGAFSAYTIMPGNFKKTGEDEEAEYYMTYEGNDSGSVAKNPLSDQWISIMISKDISKIGIVTGYHTYLMTEAIGVKRVKKSFTADDAFQQTLIYSGKVGNKIRLGYREFSNNLARPAFNNDVEYDLNESKTIGYKGARIEVLEATNQIIKYKLIQNFKKNN